MVPRGFENDFSEHLNSLLLAIHYRYSSTNNKVTMPPKKKVAGNDDAGAMQAARFGRVKNTLTMGFGMWDPLVIVVADVLKIKRSHHFSFFPLFNFLVGLPNVGKSTLTNVLAGASHAEAANYVSNSLRNTVRSLWIASGKPGLTLYLFLKSFTALLYHRPQRRPMYCSWQEFQVSCGYLEASVYRSCRVEGDRYRRFDQGS